METREYTSQARILKSFAQLTARLDPPRAQAIKDPVPRRTAEVNRLILAHADLVHRIARRISRRLPSNIELDDLVQTGMLGLIEAAARYDERSDATFETFAKMRIRGAILDSLRHSDWCSRSLRGHMRNIDGVTNRLVSETGAAPQPGAVARALGMTLDRYHGLLRDYAAALQVTIEEWQAADGYVASMEPVDTGLRPPEELESQECLDALVSAVQGLPERERAIMRLYYSEDYMMREIGSLMALSESRVCQIHKAAISKLRTALNG